MRLARSRACTDGDTRQVRPPPRLQRDRSNRVERKFPATSLNQLWVADNSYLRSWEGLVYLALVVGIISRKVAGRAMADPLRTARVLDAVAWGSPPASRRPASCTTPTAASGRIQRVRRSAAPPDRRPTGRVGSACGRAMAESFFATP
jgi:putative transposase